MLTMHPTDPPMRSVVHPDRARPGAWRFTPDAPRRAAHRPHTANATIAAIWLAAATLPVCAAQLTLEDGVVIKFGTDAQLVVRERVVAGKDITFTSGKDDAAGGQAQPASQSPAAGDWRGLRLEKSAASFGALTLSGWRIRYAGSRDGAEPGAALTVRGFSPTLQSVELTDNAVGARLVDGAASSISGSRFLRNSVGIEAHDHGALSIASTVFTGNTGLAVSNQTPSTVIQAIGNWWGHPSGPRDSVANPAGEGDAISAGVNATGWLSVIPLIGPSLRVTGAPGYTEQETIALDLACGNAVEYRVAENGTFAGRPFLPMTAQAPFTLSSANGVKQLSVEYRAATGNTVKANLSGGILLDTLGPVVTIANPGAGALITRPLTLQASATDPSGVARVEFFVDEVLIGTDTSAPYAALWDLAGPDGVRNIKVVAYDALGRASADTRSVTLRKPLLSTISVPGQSTIYGAGQATLHDPGALPPPVVSFAPSPGKALTLSAVSGKVGCCGAGSTLSSADGNTQLSTNLQSLGGIAGIRVDNRALFLAGVFLTGQPSVEPAPEALDFSGNTGFAQFAPAIGQVFYLGDGLTGNGSGATQLVAVPAGATRVYLGFAEGATGFTGVPGGYGDNVGSLSITVAIEDNAISDSAGPQLSGLSFSGTPLMEGQTLTHSGTLAVAATDASGVARVEFRVDGALVGSDSNGANGYSVTLDLYAIADGAHSLNVRAFDTLNNAAELTRGFNVALAPPAAPTISKPASGLATSQRQVAVTGSAELHAQVQLYLNGAAVGNPVSLDSKGAFSASLSLSEGANRIQAAALNRGGTGPRSSEVLVTLDSSIPQTPSGLSASAQPSGRIRLSWLRGSDTIATGYHVYRAGAAFNNVTQAARTNTSVVTATSFDDLPPADGVYHYRVVAVNAAGTLSDPSNAVSAVSDNTPPRALSIEYAPTGRVDAVSGRVGRGRVNVTLRVSESLLTAPFLSISPSGAAPLAIELARSTDTEYRGAFDIVPTTPSGTAYAVFSARDGVGNRGTEITSGASLLIDAQGPALAAISVTPAQPIRNDTSAPAAVTAELALSEATKPGELPTLSYRLSKPGRTAVPISGITQIGPLVYRAAFVLPPDAAAEAAEYFEFQYVGEDDLDNTSTQVLAANRFQVYQGDLPPAAVPVNLAATAQPSGKVKLTWSGVEEAAGYQIYRQSPGEGALSAFQRVTGTDLTDQTSVDGTHRYAVASIRRANLQEALSAPSTSVEAKADATVPDKPANLTLSLTGTGIRAQWQAPVASDVVGYNVYRSSAAPITSLDGLVPIRSQWRQTTFVDPAPKTSEPSYVVTALDAAGNESPISSSAYLNAALLPVNTLTVRQSGTQAPVLTWSQSGSTIAGYDVYLGPDTARTRLNAALLTEQTFADVGFGGDERRYTVTAIDTNGAEIGRPIVLPKVSVQLTDGLPVRRGIMNRLEYLVTNAGSINVTNAVLRVRVGNRDHVSSLFALAAGQSATVPVIVGGYSDLPATAALSTTFEAAANEGEKAEVERIAEVAVENGSLTVGVAAESLMRGAAGKVRYTLSNTTGVEMELVTALATGSQPSNELRLKLLDGDGNVLTVVPVKQSVGNVITLANGKTVARVAPGASFTADPIALPIPSSAPDRVTVVLEVDQLHYRLGQPDEVSIQGLASRLDASLLDTAYYAEVTGITPQSSFGDRDIVIGGRAVERRSGHALPSARLLLVLSVAGFERRFDVLSDAAGNFAFTFKPQPADAGLFTVSIVHPDLVERPNQGQFLINRVTVTPNQITLRTPRNFAQPIKLTAATGDGTVASGVRVVYEPQHQPLGTLPKGVNVGLSAPVDLAPKQSKTLPVTITGDNTSSDTGTLVLKVLSAELGDAPVGSVRVDYQFSEAKAALYPSPSFVEAGVAQGGSTTEQVVIENKGLAPAIGLRAELLTATGAPAPAWLALTSPADLGTIDVGTKKTVDIAVNPTAAVAEGIYTFKLRVGGTNITAGEVNVFVSVTQSGVGNVLFKAADIYTATIDPKTGNRIPGLAGARIRVQNEQVLSIDRTLTTDNQGEVLFTALPAGRYKFRATASNHQEVAGRFAIKPGNTATESIFLDYNLVTVQWAVRETTIQDRYEITLSATFETNVPAAVVMLEPPVVNLPELRKGDVFYGELNLTNYGLIRADNIRPSLPTSDAYLGFEFLTQIPTSLQAKQRITLPYRAVALKSFDPADDLLESGGSDPGQNPPDGTSGGTGGTGGGSNGNPSGGSTGGTGGSSGGSNGGGSNPGGTSGSSPGCFSYQNTIFIPYDYVCANADTTEGSTSGRWFYTSGTTCTQPGSSGVSIGGGGGGGGGFSGGGGGPSYGGLPGAKCIPSCNGPACCGGGGPGDGNGPPGGGGPGDEDDGDEGGEEE